MPKSGETIVGTTSASHYLRKSNRHKNTSDLSKETHASSSQPSWPLPKILEALHLCLFALDDLSTALNNLLKHQLSRSANKPHIVSRNHHAQHIPTVLFQKRPSPETTKVPPAIGTCETCTHGLTPLPCHGLLPGKPAPSSLQILSAPDGSGLKVTCSNSHEVGPASINRFHVDIRPPLMMA